MIRLFRLFLGFESLTLVGFCFQDGEYLGSFKKISLRSKLVFASSLVSPLSWSVAEAFNIHSPQKSESMKQILEVGVGVHILNIIEFVKRENMTSMDI